LQEVDWWAVGVMAFEMLIGHRPFHYDKERNDEVLFW
jgi:serine/threonine protein kinase